MGNDVLEFYRFKVNMCPYYGSIIQEIEEIVPWILMLSPFYCRLDDSEGNKMYVADKSFSIRSKVS